MKSKETQKVEMHVLLLLEHIVGSRLLVLFYGVGFCLEYRRIFRKVESLCYFLGKVSDNLILFMPLVAKSGHELTNAKTLSLEEEITI